MSTSKFKFKVDQTLFCENTVWDKQMSATVLIGYCYTVIEVLENSYVMIGMGDEVILEKEIAEKSLKVL